MIKLKIVFWIVILTIIFFTRFYKLADYPSHLTIDEVAIGYNAFSILKTGMDEWGNRLPISFKSVGDYKAPTLIYLTVPFVRFLGLTEISTRLPVAIFSAINIYLFWLIISRYIFSRKYPILPYLSTLIFSLAPWLIPFSRSGFEAIPAFTFLLANIIFVFEFHRSGRILHFFFMFFFAYLSAITYHSTKIVVPLLNLFFLGLEYRHFIACAKIWYAKNKLSFILTCLVFIAITAFFIENFVFGPGASRAGMTFLVKDIEYRGALVPVLSGHPFGWFTSFIALVSFWFKRLLEYFSANFYLSDGLGLSTPGHPGQGVIYTIEYPFLIIGFLILVFPGEFFKRVISEKYIGKILLAWFVFSLQPGSLTNNSQHALRTLTLVPVISILIALGIIFSFEKLRKNSFKYLLVIVLVIGYLFGLFRFYDYYTLHYPVELSETRSYGWKQMALYAEDHHREYDHVYVDPRFGTDGPYTYGVPYLYLLFYSAYDPMTYISNPRRLKGGSDFDNYLFGNINWPDIDHNQHNLYIAGPWSFPKELLNSPQQKYYVPFLNHSSGLYAISD